MSVKKERVSLTLDPGLVSKLRALYPGISLSRAVSHAVQAHLERAEIEKRMRNLEIVSRATLMLLADHIAGNNEREGQRLRHSYAQKALAIVRKAEERGRKADAGEGAAVQEQVEGE